MESINERPRPRCYMDEENYINIDVFNDGSYIYDFDPFQTKGMVEHLLEKRWCDRKVVKDVICCMRQIAAKQHRQLTIDEILYE